MFEDVIKAIYDDMLVYQDRFRNMQLLIPHSAFKCNKSIVIFKAICNQLEFCSIAHPCLAGLELVIEDYTMFSKFQEYMKESLSNITEDNIDAKMIELQLRGLLCTTVGLKQSLI